MSLSTLSIKRPVLATVMSIVIVLFGAIGLTSLGVREYPSVDPAIVSVSTAYVGANADIIEAQITEPLEAAVNGIAGIENITSTSRDGRSFIRVEFNLSVDLETAANDVRDKVSQAIRMLPPDVDPPVVSKADADAQPIISLIISSRERSLLEINEIADRTFKEQLQTIPGVSTINIWGSRRYAMRLWMDPARMAALNVTPLDIRNALLRENVELPSGQIEGSNVELTVRTMGKLTTPEEFNSLIVRQQGEHIIRLRDVAYAELGPENDRTIMRGNGIPMVSTVIVPQPGSNHVDIANEFYKRLERIKRDLPPDIQTGIAFDSTEYIKESITEVKETIFIAFLLVVIVIFAFLRDWRTTLIPVLAIPISLIGSFFIMYLAGFTINVLTLLGIVLAIGLVVDDAIVVLENIYSKIEDGMPPMEAGIKGSQEIFFAVVATTITLAAVFLPVIFLEGITGRLFREFGIVLAGSVIISAFVALTLTPMLSTKLLKQRTGHNRIQRATEPFFEKINKIYADQLQWFLEHRWMAWVVSAVAVALILGLGSLLQNELAPMEDRSSIRVQATAPEGVTFGYMDRYMTEITTMIQEKVPENKTLITMTSPGFGGGSNSGFVNVQLVKPHERERSQQQIAGMLSRELSRYTAARSFVTQSQSIGGGGRGGMPVQYVIQAPDLERLKAILPAFMEEVQQSDKFQASDLNLKFNKPEIRVTINRDKARNMGVSVMDISQTLQLGLSGQRFGYFIMDGKQYQVIGQMQRDDRAEPLNLRSLYVRNAQGQMLQLDNFIELKEDANPPQRYRFNRFVSATVSANPAEGLTIGDGIDEMDRISKKVLDETYSTSLTGSSRDFAESSSSLVFAFLLALVLIYLILSAQFESFRDPLIIMFTVPLALAGAVLTLWYFNQTLNIFSQIGIIMLIGLVTKNGILIVEFANQQKAKGLSKFDAVKKAAIQRFRPILMTSFSTILGAMPIALALGAGSESRASMGIAIIGGLTLATVLTLFVVPSMYLYISEKTKSVSNVAPDIKEMPYNTPQQEIVA